MKNHNHNGSVYRKLGLITILSVYLLILVGGVVRSTGSGMGCPDWPKCFGKWVPPTDVAELPDNYREIYSNKRGKKNDRLISYLIAFGLEKQAELIKNDKSILEEAPFNVTKTWIEYVNRLIGVLIGLFIFATMVSSLSFWKTDKVIVLVSLAAFILVGIQGWIGSIVVSTNLLDWIVTVHMLIALVIVALLIYGVHKSIVWDEDSLVKRKRSIKIVAIAALLVSVVQIVLGTQVREAIDVIASSLEYQMREEWVERIGLRFFIHRSYSLLILLLNGYLIYLVMKNTARNGLLKGVTKAVFALIIVEILSGVIMAYFAIPAFLQPVHLLVATLIFGMQFLLILSLNKETALASIDK